MVLWDDCDGAEGMMQGSVATLPSSMPIRLPGRRAPTIKRSAAADRSVSTLRALPSSEVRRSRTCGCSRAAVSTALSRSVFAGPSWSRVASPGRTMWSTGSCGERRQVQTTSSSASRAAASRKANRTAGESTS